MAHSVTSWLLIALLAGTVLVVPPVLALTAVRPQAGRPVLVVVRPGLDPARVIAGAGGIPVPGGGSGIGTLAIFSDPDFAARLARGGALFQFDAAQAGLICGDPR